MTIDDLGRKLDEQPFQPFRIHLSDQTQIEVHSPGSVVIGATTAIVPLKFGKSEGGRRYVQDWRTVALAHIVQFTDVNEKKKPKRPRKL